MTIQSVTLHSILVPLKKKIRHASHERTSSQNLVVQVKLRSGHVGYGEGVPRSYVTGETIESALGTLSRVDVAKLVGNPESLGDVVRQLEGWELPETLADPRGMNGNAARCALELAILDAYGLYFGRSIGDVIRMIHLPDLKLHPAPRGVRYSGAITAESRRGEVISAWKMRLYGFAQVKIKVGVSGQDDPRRLAKLRGILGRRVDLRLDANEAWHAPELLEHVAPLRQFQPSLLEQPVPHAEVEALAELRKALDIPVMLDESLCGYPDATRAIREGTTDFFNVRLSKCGGIISSLRLFALAERHGIKLQLGCHPGETGLLSAAGRHVAANVAGLRYVEGSYDRHVVVENLILEDITFRYGGRAPALSGPGLGVHVDPERLDRMTEERKEITYE